MANNNPFMPNGNTAPMPGAPTNTAIDNFEIDLTEVTDGYTIPDGLYKVKCIEIEQQVSKGGNPMFVWTFEVTDGQYKGFQSKVFTAITPAAMWKVAETVMALGIGQQGEIVKFKKNDVINKECGAMFEQTEYNGKTNSQISRVMTIEEMQASLK